MTIADGQAEEGGEALAREAAHWFARMRSPDAEESRPEFEAWLAEAPSHRSAYNRTAEIFAMGKLLVEPDEPVRPAQLRHGILALALAAAAACVLAVGGWIAWQSMRPSSALDQAAAATTDYRTISTIAGQARAVRLADGSTVRLGDATILQVDIGGGQRSLKLLHGQARFEVAHEQRPFIVFAGGGSVTARGTIFEVTLTPSGKVDVKLLQGAVDVALPRERATARPAIRKLAAGQSLSFVAQPDVPAVPAPPAGATDGPPTAMRDFQSLPVSELVALANQGAPRPIRVADAALGARRVSGLFRIDDTQLLARRLGALFGLGVDTSRPGEIVLVPIEDTAPVIRATDR